MCTIRCLRENQFEFIMARQQHIHIPSKSGPVQLICKCGCHVEVNKVFLVNGSYSGIDFSPFQLSWTFLMSNMGI